MSLEPTKIKADYCSNAVTCNAVTCNAVTVFVTFSAFFVVLDSFFRKGIVTGIEYNILNVLLLKYSVTFFQKLVLAEKIENFN